MKISFQFRVNLYSIAAIIELVSGAGLVVAPVLVIQLLFGSSVGATAHYISQLYGMALIGLGVTCWGKNCNNQTKIGLMLYNCLAALLLLSFAIRGIAMGIMVWPAALLHLGLGALMVGDRLFDRSV